MHKTIVYHIGEYGDASYANWGNIYEGINQ